MWELSILSGKANMDLLDKNNELDLHDPTWKIYTEDVTSLPQYIGPDAQINRGFYHPGLYHCRARFATRLIYSAKVARD